jgi:multidrug efflux pump subunit AcrB
MNIALPVKSQRKPRGQRASRRHGILDAARRLFLTEGFERATIRKIAASLDVSSAALHPVILVDQIEHDQAQGSQPAMAIADAVVRRTRPILLTAAAAILALVPLAFSVFWGPMSIAIMGGLVSATVLALFFVPAPYAAWTRVPREMVAARLPLGWKQETIGG